MDQRFRRLATGITPPSEVSAINLLCHCLDGSSTVVPIFRRFSPNYFARNLRVGLCSLLSVESSRRKAILKQAKQNQIKGTVRHLIHRTECRVTKMTLKREGSVRSLLQR